MQRTNEKNRLIAALACILFLWTIQSLSGQSTDGQPLTIETAVTRALERYPSIRVSEADVKSAAAAIQLARTAYLPKLDVVAGVNRATRNNVFGLLLPSQILAPISGPVLGTNSLESAWGSTAGVLVTWEPFDFGLRGANLSLAEAGRTRAEAGVLRSKLELSTIVADSVLTLVAAEQTVVAAQAAVDRANEFHRVTDALVKAELRPGAESSLALSEQAAAQAQLIRAQQAVAETKASLGALLGSDPATLAIAPRQLLSIPASIEKESDLAANPIAREQDAAIQESRTRLDILSRSYYPRFSVQGTVYGRGTGAMADERILGGVNGLGPNVQNWGVGFTASFPVLELPAIRARRQAEGARLDAEQGRYEQVLLELKARRDRALASYEGATQVAKTTPVAIQAARTALEQSRARYQSGLGVALEVADAQRRVAQAEIDDSLARLGVWRARLALLAAEGNISPLLTEASQ